VRAPTGKQFTISRPTSAGLASATITELAAGLRSYSVGGVDLTEPFPESSAPPFGDGIVLMPWPNRIEDGVWHLDGVPQQLDITEPARNNSLHGLLRNSPYSLVEQSDSAVTLAATVFPQNGYPFLLDTTVSYALDDDGLSVTHYVHNVSNAKAPVAIGTHPFFTISDVPSEDLILTVSASTRFDVDARLNPIREIPVEGTDYDLRTGRKLVDLSLDDAFGGVTIIDGFSRHWLEAPDGRRVELWQDESCGFVQVFTTHHFPKRDGLGLAVAVEPMTAPPNAFNTGQGLRWLEPNEEWSVRWGVRYLPARDA
jgi:aldose 1-epimerase